jgi:hypothetical protein
MLKNSKKVRMQKKDAMGEAPEGMVDGGMSKTWNWRCYKRNNF